MTKEEIKAALIAGETIIFRSKYDENTIDCINLDLVVDDILCEDNIKIKPRTITVNGIEVPEPLRVEPKDEVNVWIVDNSEPYLCIYNYSTLHKEFKNGAIHLTKEAAQAHYDALWAPSRIVK